MMKPSIARIGREQSHNRVVLELEGRAHYLFWQDAIALGKQLILIASEAEQVEQHRQLIEDGAILHKAGVPVGVTNIPEMQKEIKKEAEWGVGRKVPVPNGYVPSGEVVGIPSLRKRG